jgi:hypothetical protein
MSWMVPCEYVCTCGVLGQFKLQTRNRNTACRLEWHQVTICECVSTCAIAPSANPPHTRRTAICCWAAFILAAPVALAPGPRRPCPSQSRQAAPVHSACSGAGLAALVPQRFLRLHRRMVSVVHSSTLHGRERVLCLSPSSQTSNDLQPRMARHCCSTFCVHLK